MKRGQGCIRIANFADENDVRVLPQDGAQGLGKRQARLLIDEGEFAKAVLLKKPTAFSLTWT